MDEGSVSAMDSTDSDCRRSASEKGPSPTNCTVLFCHGSSVNALSLNLPRPAQPHQTPFHMLLHSLGLHAHAPPHLGQQLVHTPLFALAIKMEVPLCTSEPPQIMSVLTPTAQVTHGLSGKRETVPC